MRAADESLVFFESTATGSKRTFSLKVEDLSWTKLSLFAAMAPDAMQIRNDSDHSLIASLDDLKGGMRCVIEKKDEKKSHVSDWARICTVDEFHARKNKLGAVRLGVDGRDVMVLEHKGKWFAFDAVCYHFGGPLMGGSLVQDIEDLQIICPWHRFQIDLKTGRTVQSRVEGINCLSQQQMQVIHEVKLERNAVFVKLASNVDDIASSHYAIMGLYQHE